MEKTCTILKFVDSNMNFRFLFFGLGNFSDACFSNVGFSANLFPVGGKTTLVSSFSGLNMSYSLPVGQ